MSIRSLSHAASPSVYFPNLNGLRFFAAAIVIINHVEQARSMFGLQNIYNNAMVYALGDNGVTLFFVLSGFLITYLLLKEREVTGSVAIKDFYVRRILRIWPLYYLIVFLAIFLLPNINFFNWPVWSSLLQQNFAIKALLFLLIIPNANQVLFSPVAFGNQLWSIGVEEQFYLFWPWIVKYIKRIVPALLFIIVAMPLVVGLLNYAANQHLNNYPQMLAACNFLKKFLALTRVDCMATGGLAAYFLFHKNTIFIKIIFHRITQWVNLLMFVYVVATAFYVPFFSNIIHSLLFSILIVNLAANPKRLFSLEFKWLSYLGKTSYGIYMYHPLCIFTCIKLMQYFNMPMNTIAIEIVLYSIIFLSTIIVAALSYRFLETPVLAFKKRFTRIASGSTGN